MQKKRAWLAWGIIVGCLAVLIFIAVSFWSELEVRGSRIPDIAGGQKAQQTFATVSDWAKTMWLPDAEIVNCQTSYSRQTGMNEGWTFQVYSPSKNVLAIINTQGEQPRLLREVSVLYPQTPLPQAEWMLDSKQVLSNWWKNGGKTIWQRVNSDVLYLHLGLNSEAHLVWQLTVTQKDGDILAYWEFEADTTTGQVLESYEGSVP